MKIEKTTQLLELKAELEYVVVGQNIAAYRLTAHEPKSKIKGFRVCAHQPSEGFAFLDKMEKYRDGHALVSVGNLAFANADTKDSAARFGYDFAFRPGKEGELSAHTPFSALVDGQADAGDLVKLDSRAKQFFDMDGNIFPCAVRTGRKTQCYDDSRFDLRKALHILARRKGVGYSPLRLGPNWAEGAELCYIDRVNSVAGPFSSAYLRFDFQMTQAEQVEIRNQQLRYGDPVEAETVHRAIFDLDMLGLRAGGAAYYDSWGRTRNTDAYKARFKA